ncbi:MAG: hypothetical protein J5981_07205 [Lachnospira sp.]|nr:hypothetical protein [Lachnospira sp.]
MKKILSVLLMMGILLTATGCQRAADLITPSGSSGGSTQTPAPFPQIETNDPEEEETEGGEIQTKIPFTQTLEMTNEWTILGDFNYRFTAGEAQDRIVLGTSAQNENGEMLWDDSQYWTLAVIVDKDADGNNDGAYNLFSERLQGYVYAEVNEAYIKGVMTPIITLYIFSGNDREVRNYYYDGDCFVENQEFTTKGFSTGGINNLYSTMPEYKPL